MRPVLAALFVPGSRPDRFEKASRAGADIVIIDLEDAVPTEDKAAAREAVALHLGKMDDTSGFAIRVNPVGSEEFTADAELLATLRAARHLPEAVIIPKSEDPRSLDEVAHQLDDATSCIALVESAAGIMRIGEIAGHARVDQLAFGAADYAADVGCALTAESLLLPRSAIAVASAANALTPPLDTPCFSIEDSEAIRDHARQGRELGFGGSLCIHPVQIPYIREGYLPSTDEIAWAWKVIDGASESGASRVGDDMVDAPVLKRANRIVRAIESK
ncbi:MAG: CoA ester lyase [Leucobacter sp.]